MYHVPHTNFLVCTWFKMFEDCSLWCVLQDISSHPCFTAPCGPWLSPHFSTLLSYARTQSDDFHSVALSLRVHPLPLCKEGYALAGIFTGYEPKSLIAVSSEHTPRNLLLRGQLRHGLLETTVDASEVYDTTDVGRLTPTTVSFECE